MDRAYLHYNLLESHEKTEAWTARIESSLRRMKPTGNWELPHLQISQTELTELGPTEHDLFPFAVSMLLELLTLSFMLSVYMC